MGAETEIAWTDHTFNPWHGCQRVSPGCEHCYAETQDRRWAKTGTVIRAGGSIVEDEKITHWGPEAPRRFFGDAHWNEPRKWDRDAKEVDVRRRVFCASMADVFEDRRDLDDQRDRLWKLIAETPHLDWQLLTKRPENLAKMLPWMPTSTSSTARWSPYPNVWIGTTVEDQKRADERIPHLLRVPAAVRFLSCEPLLEAVNLSEVALRGAFRGCPDETQDEETDPCNGCPGYSNPGGDHCGAVHGPHVDWVIVGGESGAGARPFNLRWATSLVEQCKAAGVACFVKQLGSRPVKPTRHNLAEPVRVDCDTQLVATVSDELVKLKSRKGGDPEEWPGGADAWPREFPAVRR